MMVGMFVFIPTLWAAPVDREQAMEKARQFYNGQGQVMKARSLRRVPRANNVSIELESDCFYVFNAGEDAGYVIISGDDRTPSVLGYSDSGSFSAEDMPENMRAWLDDYAGQIRCLQQNSTLKAAQVPNHPEVPVLLSCNWDQGDPYNQKCPVFFDESKYGRCVTGCVATAMAQVMYYYRYPASTTQTIPGYTCTTNRQEYLGTSTPSYVTVPEVPVTKLDWSNMLDTYNGGETEAQQSAVATLMQAAGTSLNMDYGNESSGTDCTYMKAALTTYFDYDKSMHFCFRQDYTTTQWDQLIYNEMAARRPVLYSGKSGGGGHAFVIDGYNGQGYYHVNWGWGGFQNGYFLLSILTPDDHSGIGAGSGGGYNGFQEALIGIRPNMYGSSYTFDRLTTDCINITGDYVFSRSSASANFEGIAVAASFMNKNGYTGTFDYGFGLYDNNNNIKKIFPLRTNVTHQNTFGENCTQGATTISFGANLDNGRYRIFPVSKLSTSSDWYPNYKANAYHILADINGNELRLSYPSDHMTITLEPANNPEAGGPADLKITIASNGNAYLGNVMLYSEDAGGMLYEDNVELTNDNGYTNTQVATVIFEKTGTFEVWLALDDGYILTQTNVTVSEPKPQSLKCSYDVTNGSNTTFEIADDKMKIDITYTNEGNNLYDNKVGVALWKQSDDNPGTFIYDKELIDRLTLAAGASAKRSYVFTGLENGATYYAQMYYRTKGEWKEYFSTTTYTVRFTEPGAREAYAVVDGNTMTFYYDTQKSSRQGKKYAMNRDIIFYKNPGWLKDSLSIQQVRFDNSYATYRPTTTYRWFKQFINLTKIEGIENLNTSAVKDMSEMFYKCYALESVDVSNFYTHHVTDMSFMFYGCKSLKNLNLTGFNTSKVKNMKAMFYNCSSITRLDLISFDTHNVTDMSWMFYGCSSLINLKINSDRFNTSKVTDMCAMFYGCSSFPSFSQIPFDTGSVTNMSWMFYGCTTITALGISKFNTSNVTLMNHMFYNCPNLKSLDLSNFNTSKVTDMQMMFYNNQGLEQLNVSSFNTENVTTMNCMFYDCKNLEKIDVSNFRTPKVEDMSFMFRGCNKVKQLDLSGFSIESLKQLRVMFHACWALNTIYTSTSWNNLNIENSSWLFGECTSLVGGAGTKFDANHIQLEYARIDGGPSAPGYFTYKASSKNGDVNSDGTVDVADIANIIDIMAQGTNNPLADVNGDGTVDVADIATVISIMAKN